MIFFRNSVEIIAQLGTGNGVYICLPISIFSYKLLVSSRIKNVFSGLEEGELSSVAGQWPITGLLELSPSREDNSTNFRVT